MGEYWTTEHVGCYADGALGLDHIRRKLADLVADYPRHDPAVVQALRGEMSDDDWETYAAIDFLNEHTSPDVYWEVGWGDLMLVGLE